MGISVHTINMFVYPRTMCMRVCLIVYTVCASMCVMVAVDSDHVHANYNLEIYWLIHPNCLDKHIWCVCVCVCAGMYL